MDIANIEHLAGILAIVVGATWALSRKLGQIKEGLGEIKTVIAVHIERDENTHKAQEARIIKLESRRGRR